MNTLLEILKFTIPGILVLVVSYLLINKVINGLLDKMRIEQRMQIKSEMLPLKLQAYERLVLLMERTSLNSLIYNYNDSKISAVALKTIMIRVIQDEFTHNLTQQIYVSSQSWGMLKVIREEMILIINRAYSVLPENARGTELCSNILEQLVENDEIPSEKGIAFLKKEVELIFG